MVKAALWVRMEAQLGKEQAVEDFLLAGLPLVMKESATTAWFGVRLGPTSFAIFNAFADEAGREAHLLGALTAALMQNSRSLLAEPPSIQKIPVLDAKLPG